MARTWLQIRVELLGSAGVELPTPPGRVLIVGPRHTFADLAEAIDLAFARWDRSHLHLFRLPDGRTLGPQDRDDPEPGWIDDTTAKVLQEVGPDDDFTYVFDLGDDWEHACRVLAEKTDPVEEYGVRPSRPVPTWGWGWIPDQYGRETDDAE